MKYINLEIENIRVRLGCNCIATVIFFRAFVMPDAIRSNGANIIPWIKPNDFECFFLDHKYCHSSRAHI